MQVMATLGFVFPGQGSQTVGMLSAIAEQHAVVKEVFVQASDALGYDMWSLASDGPQERMNLTQYTQPLLLTASVALWRVWQQQTDIRPAFLSGHSLGEFSALVCAESLAFVDAVRLVQSRGEFMQRAVPVGEGAMAAVIGLDDDSVNACCEQAAGHECVQAVNYNSPGQVVIAGHAKAVERAGDLLKKAGAKKVVPLAVSAPFHTDLMKPAGEQLCEQLNRLTVREPVIPVVHNVHAQTESHPDAIKALLVQQIAKPVRWTACVRYMIDNGVSVMIECGAGKVLTGLGRRIDKTLTSHVIESPDGLQQAIDALGNVSN